MANRIRGHDSYNNKSNHKLKVYLIGSLRNPKIPKIANEIRALGFDVFDDWYAAGPEADDYWRKYEIMRGHSYREGLKGYAADHVYQFDKKHLLDCDISVLILKGGASAHLELGWVLGIGYVIGELNRLKIRHKKLNIQFKRGYILHNNPKRWDVMYQFADGVFHNFNDLKRELRKINKKTSK